MRITNWERKEQEGNQEISAFVDDFRLWYRIPGAYEASTAGDPFLAAALLPAMLKGEPLELDPSLPVSPMLLENVLQLQEIHHSWNPVLKIVPVRASTSPAKMLNEGALTFFSGGVDSMFTFLKRLDEVSHVVFIHGFDFVADKEIFSTAAARNSRFVESFGKTLIPVETNTYPFSYHHNMSRKLTHGSALASVALLLGFRKVFIPSSDAYSYLSPLGSHPLTDPLYSTEGTKLIHDGAEVRRVDKVIKIAGCAPALTNLTVCFADMNINCGRCLKCVRTMIPLHLLSAEGAPFSRTLTPKLVKSFKWNDEPNMFNQHIELAEQRGDKKMLRTLKACRRRQERTRLIKDLDRILLGSVILRIYRRFRKEPPWKNRIYPTPHHDS